MENLNWPQAFVLVALTIGATLVLLRMSGCKMPWEK